MCLEEVTRWISFIISSTFFAPKKEKIDLVFELKVKQELKNGLQS